jgi:hypothetical protein
VTEAMTSESIVEAEWILEGYWTRVRFAFHTGIRGWSDVDVLAYRPETKHLVVAESKVKGPKTHVFAYTKKWHDRYGSLAEKFDDAGYFDFLRHLPRLCKDDVVFPSFKRMVKRLTVQLVSNYFVSPEIRKTAEIETLKVKVGSRLPVPIDLRLDTTIDVLARIIAKERESRQGRRYGHPILDVAREVNRYFFPVVRETRGLGTDADALRSQLVSQFLSAIGRNR